MLTVAPLLASAVALIGAVLAFGTARRAHSLAVRTTATEERRGRSEETMRLLRWAVELAVGDHVRHQAAGVAVLRSLVTARLVVRGDRTFVEAVAAQVSRLTADGSSYSVDETIRTIREPGGGRHG